MAKTKHHYVNNKRLYGEMLKYINDYKEAKAAGTGPIKIPEYIGECIFQIATKLATKPNFIGYSFKDEMISDGIENCLVYIYNFNPDKTKNPFAYFTTIIFNAFIRRIHKEKKQLYIKHKCFENSIINNTLFSNVDDNVESSFYVVNNEKMNDMVTNFEANKAMKKKRYAKIKK